MDAGTKIAAIASGVIVLAIIAVIVSRNAQTSNVIQAATTGFSQIIGAAVQPVSNSAGGLPTFNPAILTGGTSNPAF